MLSVILNELWLVLKMFCYYKARVSVNVFCVTYY